MENETEEKKGWRRWLVRALFESALIILSIIAALAVNEWRDTRELQSQVRQGRAAFAQEIQANYETLLSEQPGLPYHKRLWRRYQDLGTKPVITIENLSRSAKSSRPGSILRRKGGCENSTKTPRCDLAEARTNIVTKKEWSERVILIKPCL